MRPCRRCLVRVHCNSSCTGLPPIASYCLLLHLSKTLGRELNEIDVLAAVSQYIPTDITEELHSMCDGWVQFAVRDLLVLTHEAAVSSVLRQLSQRPGSEKRQSAQEVISSLVSQHLDSGLSGLGLSVNADQPISDLFEAVLAALEETVEIRGLASMEWLLVGITAV